MRRWSAMPIPHLLEGSIGVANLNIEIQGKGRSFNLDLSKFTIILIRLCALQSLIGALTYLPYIPERLYDYGHAHSFSSVEYSTLSLRELGNQLLLHLFRAVVFWFGAAAISRFLIGDLIENQPLLANGEAAEESHLA